MTENKNLNHTFSSDVNMPLYLIRFRSLITVSLMIEDFFFRFFFSFFFLVCVCVGGGAVGCGHMFTIL